MNREKVGTRWRKVVAGAVLSLALMASFRGAPAKATGAVILEGDLFYTKFADSPRVKKVPFSYDGSSFTLGAPQGVANTPGADGVVFGPDGDLLVGGQGNQIFKVNPTTGTYQTRSAGGTASFHLALDPSGTTLWSAGIPGALAEVPLSPFANGTYRPLSGSDTSVTSLAFDNAGNGYYTSSGSGGYGSVGRIDLSTFTTTRVLTSIPAAHGMAFDKHTGHLMLFGSDHITQIDPATMTVVADRVFSGMGFDQGTVDGKGHMFVASNNGYLFFMDYAASGNIGTPTNFYSIQYLDSYLDDVAPLTGPGAQVNQILLEISGGGSLPVGATASVTARAVDIGGNGISAVPITLTSAGVHPGVFSGVTDADGKFTAGYTGTNAGDDTLVATGGGATSAPAVIHWTACAPAPTFSWLSPLSAAAPYTMPAGGTVDIRFQYGDCTGNVADPSVIMMVTDALDENQVVTAWVYGADIAIDGAEIYHQSFNPATYGLGAGRSLKVWAFLGDELRSTAIINLAP